MITIKEEFLTDPKTIRAIELGGWDTIGLWLAMKAYAASKLTDGFVPDEIFDKLPGAPPNARVLVVSLVECGLRKRDGSMGAGLVERETYGWQLHDYLDHANSSEVEALRRKKEREKKHRQRHPDAVVPPQTPPSVPTNVPASVPVAVPPSAGDPRAHAGAPAQPSPAQPKERVALTPPVRNRFEESFSVPHEDVVWAFERWKETFGKPGALFDSKRASCLIDRQLEGMSRQDVEDVLAGAQLDDYVMGRGKHQGRPNTRLMLLFGDREQYESFLERGKAKREGRLVEPNSAFSVPPLQRQTPPPKHEGGPVAPPPAAPPLARTSTPMPHDTKREASS